MQMKIEQAVAIRLEAMHYELTEYPPVVGAPLRHTAESDIWQLALETTDTGQLCAAEAVRRGCERYRFVKNGGKWQPAASYPYASTHFYNLVTLATQENLDWESIPQ